MTHTFYDRLIAVLDVFINEWGGGIRLRGIQTALLIQRTTLAGRGISISEVRQVTGAPLENIRRHFTRQVELGTLRTAPDPDDERVVRYQVVDRETHKRVARRMAAHLYELRPTGLDTTTRAFDAATYSALIDALQAFANTMDGGLRIRGIKIAIVIQQATLTGKGMTASQIARSSGAPLETVRRNIHNYIEVGNLTVIEDPNDSRATRVLYREPERVEAFFRTITDDLDSLDWAALNLL